MACCGQRVQIVPVNNLKKIVNSKYKPVIDRMAVKRQEPQRYPSSIDKHRV